MRVLLVGYGSIGKRHYALLKKNPNIDTVDIVSKYAKDDDVKFTSLECISDELLGGYDGFFVCTETALHREQLIYIDKNVVGKVILIEKPLSHSSFEYKPRNKVYVAYNLRFHPIVKQLIKILEGEKLLSFSASVGQYLPAWRPGTDYSQSYSADINRGGGVLRDLSHELDYTQFFCGDLELLAALATSNSHLNIQADDICTVLCTNEVGVHIQIQMDYLSFKPKRTVSIQTDSKTIIADFIQNSICIYSPDGSASEVDLEEVERDYTYELLHAHLLNKECSGLTTYTEAQKLMKLIDTITDNFMEKKWIKTA